MRAVVDSSATRRALADYTSDLLVRAHRVLELGIGQAEKLAKSTNAFKDRTGDGRKSIHGDVSPGYLKAKLSAGKKQIKFIENGTKPHEIRARKARFLSFVVNGTRVFRRKVQHPGTKATHFMRDAVQTASIEIRRNLQHVADDAARRFSR